MTSTVNYKRFQMKKLVLREIKHSVVHGAGKKGITTLFIFDSRSLRQLGTYDRLHTMMPRQ